MREWLLGSWYNPSRTPPSRVLKHMDHVSMTSSRSPPFLCRYSCGVSRHERPTTVKLSANCGQQMPSPFITETNEADRLAARCYAKKQPLRGTAKGSASVCVCPTKETRHPRKHKSVPPPSHGFVDGLRHLSRYHPSAKGGHLPISRP